MESFERDLDPSPSVCRLDGRYCCLSSSRVVVVEVERVERGNPGDSSVLWMAESSASWGKDESWNKSGSMPMR